MKDVFLAAAPPRDRKNNDLTESETAEQVEAPATLRKKVSEKTKTSQAPIQALAEQDNELSESSEPIYSDPADDFASSSHDHDEDEEDNIDILGLLKNRKNKVLNIGDHIKLRKKGLIGGKIVCDRNGCHPVDYSNESSL